MKRLLSGLAAAAALLIGAGAAMADGLPYSGGPRASIKDTPMQAGCAQFGGFYVGANIAEAMYRADRTDHDGYFNGGEVLSGTFSATDDGFAGGIQGGYNYQKGCTVFGVEVDWTWTDAKANTDFFPNSKGGPLGSIESHLNNFGTLRTRDGIVVDNVLLYVTGGLAWANIDTKYTNSNICCSTETTSFNETRWGWTAGFGSDWMINNNLSITSQVLYLGFDNKKHSINSSCGCDYAFTHDDSAWVSRIGFNWRFGDRREEMAPLK